MLGGEQAGARQGCGQQHADPEHPDGDGGDLRSQRGNEGHVEDDGGEQREHEQRWDLLARPPLDASVLGDHGPDGAPEAWADAVVFGRGPLAEADLACCADHR